ncbi:MAG: lysophospholipid acyltransferase family protein [Spirosomaceae bacterium]|jgi:KDO2-lipid IV(A) lauroyltransferase|nr:lysophospholipid acyltransferase family protein [Spirosomataceae bacterium]
MQAIVYYLAFPLLYFISILPFPILYLLSDFCYFLVYRVVGYRKKVVRLNLTRSFPEKSHSEIIEIEKKFYRNLTDIILETLKCISTTPKDINNCVTLGNFEVVEKYKRENKNIIITGGHCGNYEFVCQFVGLSYSSNVFPLTPIAVYRKLANPRFEKLFFKFRTKFGSILYPTEESYKAINNQDTHRPFAYFLINDQSAIPERAYFTTFLNQETTFFKGSEMYARKYDMPVVYMSILRKGRGKYHLTFEVIADEPAKTKEGEILEKHARLLEKDIIKDPANWLWSHKRWKYKMVDGEYQGVNYH